MFFFKSPPPKKKLFGGVPLTVLLPKKSTEAKRKQAGSWSKELREKLSQAPFRMGSDTVVLPTIQFSVLEFRKPPVLDANTDRTKLEQETNFMLFNRNLLGQKNFQPKFLIK